MKRTTSVLVAALSIPVHLAGTVLVEGVVSATAAPAAEPCGAIPAGLDLVVPHDGGIVSATAEGHEQLPTAVVAGEPSMAVRGPDGTVWVHTAGTPGGDAVHRVAPGGTAASLSLESEALSLTSVGWLEGRTAATLIDRSDRPREFEDIFGAVFIEFADGEQRDLGPSRGPEFGVGAVTIGAGRLAEFASVDLTESFGYRDATGADLTDWHNPTEGAPYNAPPLWLWPVAAMSPTAPGAVDLTWVEGPDWDGATQELTGGWKLVVADAVSGEERTRIDLGEPGAVLIQADFDGRFWVGTFSQSDAGGADEPGRRSFVVDVTTASPAPAELQCQGVVPTIDRLGAPQPPDAGATGTTTSAAPTTTTTPPPVCPTYEPNAQYPIRLCDEGPAVEAVQRALVAAGHNLAVDGYFGPRTEVEVRRFQRAHDLAVDGLAGPETWVALLPFAPPEGVDGNGNGIVDPWEVGTTAPSERDSAADYVGDRFWQVETNVVTADDEVLYGENADDVGADFRLWWTVNDGDRSMVWLAQRIGPGPADDHAAFPGEHRVVASAEFNAGPDGRIALFCTSPGLDGVAARLVGDSFTPDAALGADIAAGTLVEIDPATVTCE